MVSLIMALSEVGMAVGKQRCCSREGSSLLLSLLSMLLILLLLVPITAVRIGRNEVSGISDRRVEHRTAVD